LDTSEIVERLKPLDINSDYMEHSHTDHIVDAHVKGTHQQKRHLYRVVKAGQLVHQGKWFTRGQIQQKFPHLMGNSTQWRPLFIQVDISIHPPIPTRSHTNFILAVSVFILVDVF